MLGSGTSFIIIILYLSVWQCQTVTCHSCFRAIAKKAKLLLTPPPCISAVGLPLPGWAVSGKRNLALTKGKSSKAGRGRKPRSIATAFQGMETLDKLLISFHLIQILLPNFILHPEGDKLPTERARWSCNTHGPGALAAWRSAPLFKNSWNKLPVRVVMMLICSAWHKQVFWYNGDDVFWDPSSSCFQIHWHVS